MPEPDDLLTSAELAEALRVNERTVRKWRNDGTGPPVMWAGGHARYLWRDVLEWMRRKDQPPSPPCGGCDSADVGVQPRRPRWITWADQQR